MEDKSAPALEHRVRKLETKVRLLIAFVEAVGWATVAAALALVLVFVPRSGGRILPHAFNVAHVALSAVVALVAYRLTRRLLAQIIELPRWFPWFAGVAAVVLFGGGLEVAQLFVPGQASWRDFAIDVMGGVAGLLLVVPPAPAAARVRQWAFRALGVLVAVAAVAPSVRAISSIVVRDKRFPEIVRFQPGYQPFVYLRGGAKLSAVTAHVDPKVATGSVQLTFPSGGYAGVATTPPRGNWKPFKHLVVPVYSLGDQPVRLNLRVHDFGYKGNAEDRFNAEVVLAPGANELRFAVKSIQTAPQGRVMELDEVGYVSLSSSERTEPVALLLKPWRLE